MWKLLLLVIFLSADAERLKVIQSNRQEIDVSGLGRAHVPAHQEIVTYRLPNQTIPELYTITLNFEDFHDEQMKFTGDVLISILVVEDTDTITLHSSGLVIDSGSTTLITSQNVLIPHTLELLPEYELLIFKTTNVTLKKDLILRLYINNYEGTIGSSIAGVYRGSYQHDGEDRFLLLLHVVYIE